MPTKPKGCTESHDIRGPQPNSAAARAIEAIYHAKKPLTIDEGVAITGLFYGTRYRHIGILTRCVNSGWLDCAGEVYSLTPNAMAMLDQKFYDAPGEATVSLVPPPYRPVYNVEYRPAPHPRASELRDMSFKTGSCGSNSVYWSQAA